jgi:hypothetical protein
MATSPGSDPQDYTKFERKIVEEINKREAPTFIEGESIPANFESRSYFDVYELDFGRLDDEPPLVIVGNDAQIALQSSLLRAIDQMMGMRGFGSFNFWAWAKEFEDGFDSFQGSPELKKMRIKEIYPGVKKENRPKIVPLKPEKTAAGWDFYAVQVFPNREIKTEWHIFSGSYRAIADKIEIWWNQKEGEGQAVGGKPRLTSDISQLSKHPYIELFFKEIPTSGREGTRLESEISFRLMDQIEYEGLLPNKTVISLNDIKRYAKAIERIFMSGNKPYVIKRGRGSYTYNDWPLGYKLWLLGNSAAEAERIFKDVLKIQGHSFNEIYMGIGAARNPAKKYPVVEPPKKVLNENKKMPNRRQTGEVTFRWARLVLPMIKDSLVLASRERRMPVDERLE